MAIWIGVSGWIYDDWRGPFYPADLPASRRLAYVGRQFSSVEINGTFYSLKTARAYRGWHEQTPPGFVFALKGSRFITHNKKLAGVEAPLANFFASGLLLLADKLGPIVWQLPATARFEPSRLERFLAALPRNTRDAARLASQHDERVRDPGWPADGRPRRLRYALEVRHESFFVPELVRILRRFDVALVVSDAAGWRCVEEVTASFVYLRLHGHEQTYASPYGNEALATWAASIRAWAAGGEPPSPRCITGTRPRRRTSRDVYVYFDNDIGANAPRDALMLADLLRR